MGSQAARTATMLREQGWFVEKVEQIVHGTFIKRDCFGFLDFICVKVGEPGVTGIQVCASERKADHVAKARYLEAIWTWIRAGNRVIIHSWRKRSTVKKDGGWGPKRWAVVEVPLTLDDMMPEPNWKKVRAKLKADALVKRVVSNEKRMATIALKKTKLAGGAGRSADDGTGS